MGIDKRFEDFEIIDLSDSLDNQSPSGKIVNLPDIVGGSALGAAGVEIVASPDETDDSIRSNQQMEAK